jgi:formate dehydrogenase iron-sulfur subunit
VKSQRKTDEAALLRELCDTMTNASLCALGGMTAFPVESALRHFPEDFGLPREGEPCTR